MNVGMSARWRQNSPLLQTSARSTCGRLGSERRGSARRGTAPVRRIAMLNQSRALRGTTRGLLIGLAALIGAATIAACDDTTTKSTKSTTTTKETPTETIKTTEKTEKKVETS